MKTFLITAIASMALLTMGCMENKSDKEENQLQAIFPKGELGPADTFTGKATGRRTSIRSGLFQLL